ncbi:hypothetical protein Tco_1450197 [Tanacetum coccineum]
MSQPANDDFSQHLSDDEASYHEDASDNGTATNKPKQQQQQLTLTTISNIKLLIMKKEEYDIWAMKMEHYLEYIDNDVWKVIQNGNSKKRISTRKDGVVRILPPVSAAEIHAIEKERKARTILLMAIPKEHLRRFQRTSEKISSGAGKKEQNQNCLLTMDDGFVNWGEQTLRGRRTNHALMAIISNNEYLMFKNFIDSYNKAQTTLCDEQTIHNYTPKPQEEIDDSLYVYGKKGHQKPEISDLDDNSTEHSTCQSNNSEGSFGNPSKHSADSESESISVPNEMSTSKVAKPVWNNANRVNHANQFVLRPVQLNVVRSNVNTDLKENKQPVPTSNSNSFSPVRPQGNWGTAVKTSAGYNWRRTRPNSNYNSGSNFVRTVNVKGPQGRPKPEKAFGYSGHMTGNKDHLDDFEECKGGSVTFGGSKGYITGKGRIREEDEDEELIVLPTVVKHTAVKVGPRKSSTNSKVEEFLTEFQNLNTQEKEAYSTSISKDTPEILAFRRELDKLAQKNLMEVPKNKSTTPLALLQSNMLELMRLYSSLVQLMMILGPFGNMSELGAAVCTMVGITSEEEDASESFSRIGIPKNGSLFIYKGDGASWSTIVEEGEPVDAAGSGATTSVIGAMTSGAGRSTLDGGLSNSSNSG